LQEHNVITTMMNNGRCSRLITHSIRFELISQGHTDFRN
jgi:hypothetical protein